MSEDLKDAEPRDKWKTAIQKANQLELEERRQTVESMRLQGLTVRDIADKLGISRSTVQRDLDTIKQENSVKITATQSDELMAEAMSYYHELETEAWSSYRAAKAGSSQAIKALDLIRVIQGDKIKAFKDTGFIRTDETQHVEVQVNHRLEQVATPEMMEAMSKYLLEQGLTTDLEEPIHESEILDAEVVPDEEENIDHKIESDVSE